VLLDDLRWILTKEWLIRRLVFERLGGVPINNCDHLSVSAVDGNALLSVVLQAHRETCSLHQHKSQKDSQVLHGKR